MTDIHVAQADVGVAVPASLARVSSHGGFGDHTDILADVLARIRGH